MHPIVEKNRLYSQSDEILSRGQKKFSQHIRPTFFQQQVPLFPGCVATLKNLEGKTARLLAKANNHKLAVKMCRKAERTKSVKSGTQLPVVKVCVARRIIIYFPLIVSRKGVLRAFV